MDRDQVAINGVTGEEIKIKRTSRRGRPRKSEAGFDKAAWQREYMRNKRAAEKAKS